MKKVYHVTTKANWEKIKLKGLKPAIGLMSGYVADLIWMAEKRKAVYFFLEIGNEDFWYFVDNWMARMYGNENLVLLEVKFPKNIRKIDKKMAKNLKRYKSQMKALNLKCYLMEDAFYNYEIRAGRELVCYKRIPVKCIRQIPFPDKRYDG